MIDVTLTAGPPALPGCDCTLEVRIRNDGSRPATFDNPAALLAAPKWSVARWPDGDVVPADNAQNFQAPADQPARRELAPGAEWHASVRLRLPPDCDVPGEYAVVLIVARPESDPVASAPCRVRVAEWAFSFGAIGYGSAPGLKAGGDALMIQAGEHQDMLYRMPWADDHSDRIGHGGAPPVPLLQVARGACDPLVPVRDAPFMADPARWVLWREGTRMHARNAFGQRVELALESQPTAVLQPALQRNGGAIEVFVLVDSGRRLEVLQFPRDAGQAPVMTARIGLPFPAENGTTAFASEGGTLVVLGSNSPDGAALILVERGVPHCGVFTNLVHPDLVLEASVPPAVLVLASDVVQVAALVRSADGLCIAKLRLKRIATDADRHAGWRVEESELRRIGSPDILVHSGALLLRSSHHGHDDDAARATLAAMLWTRSGSIMTLDESCTLVEGVFGARPVWPGAMAAGHAPLVLAFDPLLGPFMAES